MKQLEQLLGVALILCFAVATRGTNGQTCISESFPPTGQFRLEGQDVSYLVHDALARVGFLVIVPDMRFNCYGTITGWSAFTRFRSNDKAKDSLHHDITFQLWRPSAEDSSIYTFVGSQAVELVGESLRENLIVDNDTQYLNFTSAQSSDERLTFQPGDIVGWYIHTLVTSIEVPLTVVYRSSSSTDDPSLQPVDMYVKVINDTNKADTPPPCELSLCSDQLSVIPSVIPYVKVEYEEIQDPTSISPTVEGDAMCVNTTLESCHVTPVSSSSMPATPPTTPSSPSPPPTPTANTVFTLPVIVGLSTVAVLTVATVTFIIIVCLCARKRTCVLGTPTKRRSSFHDNPTYTSPDDFIRLDNSPTLANSMFNPVLHYHADNGALYALPESNTPLSNSRTELDPENIFDDGGCYASTYQTNGQCHVYQELTETRKEKRGSLFSQSSLHITKQELPELPVSQRTTHTSMKQGHSLPRFSISTSTLPAHFPYTMPNTPAPSHPYLEAIDSRTLQLPRTPDDTPPQSAGAIPHVNGTPVRRLFHSIDDEGYHVPTHEQRMEFLTNGSTEELYSRLNRPHAKSRDSREMNFFEQSEFYWEPPSSTAELYNQLARRKYREIHRNQVHVLTALGSGYFGAVSRGYWEVPGGRMDIAIKFLQPGSKEEDKALFLQEAAIMGQFLHPNIVKLHGVVTVGEPLMIVLELMPNGDLKNYLRDLKNRVPNLPLDLAELFLNFCRQIGFGMNYLSNKAFIHRDLAARNILLTQDLTCKIGDFGMTRALSGEEIYQSHGGKIPLKWTAPEALNYRRFTAGSDVWSYGMVLFEIWSLGQQPFRKISDANELKLLVNSGHCQAPPPGCPRAIYQLMVDCWHPVDERRPRFSKICDYLSVSDEFLLHWSHDDRIVSPEVTHLGAPLSVARNLYPDLQFTYNKDTAV